MRTLCIPGGKIREEKIVVKAVSVILVNKHSSKKATALSYIPKKSKFIVDACC